MSTQLTTQPIDPSFFERCDATLVTWLGMAGVLINSHGTILLIDPLIATAPDDASICEVGYKLKVPFPILAIEVPRADLIAYTHADDDHIGPLTARALADLPGSRFMAPPPVKRMLEENGIAPQRITTSVEGLRVQVGPVEIVVTPALHDWQKENPWTRQDCCGYVVKTPDGVIWHPGDTRLIPDLLEIQGVDILFFDVAAVDAHLGPDGSAQLARSCGAKTLFAYHYGTFDLPPGSFASFDPQDALPYVQDLAAQFLVCDPGEILELS
jgi:L-ascorbate metabolism protein UlaG (beta-lactamase superfamily)